MYYVQLLGSCHHLKLPGVILNEYKPLASIKTHTYTNNNNNNNTYTNDTIQGAKKRLPYFQSFLEIFTRKSITTKASVTSQPNIEESNFLSQMNCIEYTFPWVAHILYWHWQYLLGRGGAIVFFAPCIKASLCFLIYLIQFMAIIVIIIYSTFIFGCSTDTQSSK